MPRPVNLDDRNCSRVLGNKHDMICDIHKPCLIERVPRDFEHIAWSDQVWQPWSWT